MPEPQHPDTAHSRGMTGTSTLPEVLSALGGVATRAQLKRHGFTGPALTQAVRGGVVLRLRRSRYAVLETADDITTAIMLGGRLGGLSAAASYGWWRGADEGIHVSWPAHGNVAKPGRVRFGPATGPRIIHHWRVLHSTDADAGLWREPPLEALAQVLLSADRETAIACADSAIRTGVLTDAAVRTLLRSLPGRVAQWECYLDGRSDSGIETIVRIWLIDRGIPFLFHPKIPGIGEVDFLIGRSHIVETDGRAFHESIADAARDARRDNTAAIRGYITQRIRYAFVMYHPEWWQQRILEHLGRGDTLRHIR